MYLSRNKIFFLLLSVNILLLIAFVLISLVPNINPHRYWYISLSALLLPVIIIFLIFIAALWLRIKPAASVLNIILLVVCGKSILAVFAYNIQTSTFNQEKQAGAIRVVDWNVDRFVNLKAGSKSKNVRQEIMLQIAKQNADVLCFQEFHTSTKKEYYNNLKTVILRLNYPYYYYSWDVDTKYHWSGQAIFSRYPIINKGIIHFPKPGIPESVLYADIVFNRDTVRFYTTHLQSVQFNNNDYSSVENVNGEYTRSASRLKNVVAKLKYAHSFRAQQADIVRKMLDTTKYPFIVTADLNDVPNSYSYSKIKGQDLQDAFLQKGFGIGRTFTRIFPTLRIDYIFTSKTFKVLQFKTVNKKSSDHYMLVTDILLKK